MEGVYRVKGKTSRRKSLGGQKVTGEGGEVSGERGFSIANLAQ